MFPSEEFFEHFGNKKKKNLARKTFATMQQIQEIFEQAFSDIEAVQFHTEKSKGTLAIQCRNITYYFYKTDGVWKYDGWETCLGD